MWDTKFSIPYGYKEDAYVANQARAMLNNATASLGSNIMVGDKMLPTGISRQDAKMGSLDVNLRSYHQLSTAAQEVIKRNIANQYGVAKEDLPPEMLNKGFMDVLRKITGRDPTSPNFNPRKSPTPGFGPALTGKYTQYRRERASGGVERPEYRLPELDEMLSGDPDVPYKDVKRYRELRVAFDNLHDKFYKELGPKMGTHTVKRGVRGYLQEFTGPDRNLYGMMQALRHAHGELGAPSRNIIGQSRLSNYLNSAEKMLNATISDYDTMIKVAQAKGLTTPGSAQKKVVATQTPAQAQAQKQTAQPAPSPAPSVIPTPKPKKKAKKTPAQTQEESKAQTTVPEPTPQPAPAKVGAQEPTPAPKPKKGGAKKPKISVNTPITPYSAPLPESEEGNDNDAKDPKWSEVTPPPTAGFGGFKVKKAGS